MAAKVFAVGSGNARKLESVELAGGIVFPDHDIDVRPKLVRASTISAQPMSTAELILGARNRANHARIAHSNADYSIGIESGLSQIDEDWYDSGIVLAIDRDGKEAISESLKLAIGGKIMELVLEGQELSLAVANVTGLNTVETRDCFSALTDGKLSAVETYRDATVAALSQLVHSEFY